MPLVECYQELAPVPPSSAAAALIAAAAERSEQFIAGRLDHPIAAFVPSNAELVYQGLAHLARTEGPADLRFCEWGAGLGVATCLAAELGFAAYGLEVEPELVAEARRLAEDFGSAAQFVCGSFVPRGGEAVIERAADVSWMTVEADDGYEQLGFGPEDFDVFFCYPWPGEEPAYEALVEHYAHDGAVLVMFRGVEGLRMQRLTARRRRGRRVR